MSPPVAKEMGFSLTSRSVSLQHVAMATENLLKGLNAFAGVRERGFHVTVFADLNWSAAKNVRVCVCVFEHVGKCVYLCLSGVACTVCMYVCV